MNFEHFDFDRKIESYKNYLINQFAGLSKEQQIYMFYRNIIRRCQKQRELLANLNESKNNQLSQQFLIDDLLYLEAFSKVVGFSESLKATVLHVSCSTENKFKELYADSLAKYQLVLENYKQLASELQLDNAMQLSHLFAYLLWNGYLSVTKEHHYNLKGRLLLPEMHSFDVINGQGVCLSYAEFLHHFLETCHQKSAMLDCLALRKNNINHFSNINRKICINRSIVSKISDNLLPKILLEKRVGNHEVTLIEDDDKIYIYDVTDLCVLNVINKDEALLVNGKGTYNIKPLSTLVFNPYADPNNIFEKLLMDNVSPAFNEQEVIACYEQTLDLIMRNISLLDDAYDNIHPFLEFISNQTKELGNIKKCYKKIKLLNKKK